MENVSGLPVFDAEEEPKEIIGVQKEEKEPEDDLTILNTIFEQPKPKPVKTSKKKVKIETPEVETEVEVELKEPVGVHHPEKHAKEARPKKKLTQKQIEGLQRGRETRARNLAAKKAAKLAEKGITAPPPEKQTQKQPQKNEFESFLSHMDNYLTLVEKHRPKKAVPKVEPPKVEPPKAKTPPPAEPFNEYDYLFQ